MAACLGVSRDRLGHAFVAVTNCLALRSRRVGAGGGLLVLAPRCLRPDLLRALRERGDLVPDGDGRWVISGKLDWETFPARVEGVIEERVARLTAEQRATLNIASVEGEVFTGE